MYASASGPSQNCTQQSTYLSFNQANWKAPYPPKFRPPITAQTLFKLTRSVRTTTQRRRNHYLHCVECRFSLGSATNRYQPPVYTHPFFFFFIKISASLPQRLTNMQRQKHQQWIHPLIRSAPEVNGLYSGPRLSFCVNLLTSRPTNKQINMLCQFHYRRDLMMMQQDGKL